MKMNWYKLAKLLKEPPNINELTSTIYNDLKNNMYGKTYAVYDPYLNKIKEFKIIKSEETSPRYDIETNNILMPEKTINTNTEPNTKLIIKHEISHLIDPKTQIPNYKEKALKKTYFTRPEEQDAYERQFMSLLKTHLNQIPNKEKWMTTLKNALKSSEPYKLGDAILGILTNEKWIPGQGFPSSFRVPLPIEPALRDYYLSVQERPERLKTFKQRIYQELF